MIISRLDYSQNIGAYDEWHLKDLRLGQLNLIASKNAVGKTRTVNVITHLASMINGKQPQLSNGDWDLVFKAGKGSLRYRLRIEGQQVAEESLIEKGQALVSRSADRGKVIHFRNGQRESHNFYPPKDKLTNQVRRDLKELVYLEDLTNWANNLHSVTFSNIRMDIIPMLIQPPEKPDLFIANLNLIPFMLKKMVDNVTTKRMIIRDLNSVGYGIKDIDVSIPRVPNAPKDSLIIRIVERGLKHPIDQMSFSQGMHRVIAIIITVNYLLGEKGSSTLVCDDFAEGLDFERATKLAKIVFRRMKDTEIQLILTSNERFLMNAVDIQYWNILERRGHTVQAFNYGNSKKAFDEFARAGLNNFDFFANQLYKDLAHA